MSREPFNSFPEVPVPSPPPTRYTLSPSKTQTHKHTHTLFVCLCCVTSLSFTLSLIHSIFSVTLLSRSVSLSCLSHAFASAPPPFPTSSTRPHPSSCPLHPPPSRSLIISLHQCDCHAGQTVKAKTCNLLICITSFLSSRQRRFSKMFMHKAKPKLGLSVPNQPLLTIQGPFVGTHDGVILPFCFLLLARGCQGFAGGRWLKKQGQMSSLLMGIGLDEHKWSLSL